MRQIRVGPQSAGSEPGPACYQRGGSRPTVTDADLLLGRLDADYFAGGAIALAPQLAADAILRDVGRPLALDESMAAYGMSEVVDENMANAGRVHAVENGRDIADYTMITFGGAGPVHAARLCEKLGIARFLVPPGRRRRLGHRFPARAIRLRGGPQRLHAPRQVRCRAR